jgi:HtrA serine peptidase 2
MLQLTPSVAAQLQKRDPAFPPVASGILVPSVTAGSPADRAGIQAGDVICGFAGQSDVTTANLIKVLGRHVGKPMPIEVWRASGRRATLMVTAVEAAL